MPLQIGELLSERYEVVRPIRSGAMGAVYEVRDRNVAGKIRAAKEILDAALQGPNTDYVQAKFLAEMQSLAALSHPGIPQVIDFFHKGPASFIVMDYIQGLNLEDELRQRMCENGSVSDPQQVVQDALEVLEILTYLHQQEPPVLHRDVKPANLIRHSRSKKIYLVDFGLARSHQEGQQQTRVGTPGYCAQEQMAGKAEPRSELYSLGVTMHHLLSGKAPKMLSCDPLVDLIPGFDRELSSIVDRATQIRARERFQSASEMAAELERWLKRKERAHQQLDESVIPAAPPPGPNFGSSLVYVCGLVVLLSGLGAGVWMSSARAHEQNQLPAANQTQTSSTAPAALNPAESDNRELSSTPSKLAPVSNRDYLAPPSLHRHHHKVKVRRARPLPALPAPAAEPVAAQLQAGADYPRVEPRPRAGPKGSGLPFTRDDEPLPTSDYVQIGNIPGFLPARNEGNKLVLHSAPGPLARDITMEAFGYLQPPARALQLKLASHEFHQPGYNEPLDRQTPNTAVVRFRDGDQRRWNKMLAVNYRGGSIVYRYQYSFRSDQRPGEFVKEMKTLVERIKVAEDPGTP